MDESGAILNVINNNLTKQQCKRGQTTVFLRSLSSGKPNRLNVVCPRFYGLSPILSPDFNPKPKAT
jgi:hypothetical protein